MRRKRDLWSVLALACVVISCADTDAGSQREEAGVATEAGTEGTSLPPAHGDAASTVDPTNAEDAGKVSPGNLTVAGDTTGASLDASVDAAAADAGLPSESLDAGGSDTTTSSVMLDSRGDSSVATTTAPNPFASTSPEESSTAVASDTSSTAPASDVETTTAATSVDTATSTGSEASSTSTSTAEHSSSSTTSASTTTTAEESTSTADTTSSDTGATSEPVEIQNCDVFSPQDPAEGYEACPSGMGCYLGAAVTYCAEAGSLELGNLCEVSHECSPGLSCVVGVCHTVCSVGEQCGGLCITLESFNHELGVCEQTCDPTDNTTFEDPNFDACLVGTRCNIFTEGRLCAVEGTAFEEDPCSLDMDCTAGFVCLGASSPVCRRYCPLTTGGVDIGDPCEVFAQTCTPINPPVIVDDLQGQDDEYGFCF